MAHLQKESGISMSDETFRQLLKRHGYVYRRPKHDLTPLQDPEARERAEDLLDSLKKRPMRDKRSTLWGTPTFLHGRNHNNSPSYLAEVLDEERNAKESPCSRATEVASSLRSLQLFQWRGNLE